MSFGCFPRISNQFSSFDLSAVHSPCLTELMTMSIQTLESILPLPVFSSIALTSSRHQNQGDVVMKLVLTTSTNYGKLIWDFYQTVGVQRDSQPVRLVQILIALDGSRLTGLHTSQAAEFYGFSNLVISSSICIWELELSSSTNYQTRICKRAELIHTSWAKTNLSLVDLLNEPKILFEQGSLILWWIELSWAEPLSNRDLSCCQTAQLVYNAPSTYVEPLPPWVQNLLRKDQSWKFLYLDQKR